MQGVRTGNKNVPSTVSTKRDTGSFGCEENSSKHKTCENLLGHKGEGVHGMPLFSDAAGKAGD